MMKLEELRQWERKADSYYRSVAKPVDPDEHEPFGWELEPERMKVSRWDRDYILGDEK